MKIIIYGLNFKPEEVGVGKFNGELADYLHKKGHDLRIITAPQYYPEWIATKNEYSIEDNFTYKVFRCPIYVPQSPSGLKRIIHLISFAITSFPILITQIVWKPDCLILIAPTIICIPNLFLLKFFSPKKIFYMLHIQDFEIEAAFNLKMIKTKLVKKWILNIETNLLKSFQVLGTISHAMCRKLYDKGFNKKDVYYLPNWVDVKKIKPKKIDDKNKNFYRKSLGISDDVLIIQYSGSMNRKQGFNFLIPIINYFGNRKNIFWLFAGEGPMKKYLINSTRKIVNIKFLPLQKENQMNEWLNAGDIHIIPQIEGVEDLLFPSKLIGILASGNPVISNASKNSDLGKVVENSGIRVNPGDQKGFIRALNRLINNEKLRISLGKKARSIACKEYSKELILEKFENMLKDNIKNN